MSRSKSLCLTLMMAAVWVSALPAHAVDSAAQDAQKEAAYQQAREDYKLYLQQLKELARQYKEVSGEIRKIVQEEGLPTFEDAEPVKEGAAASDTRIEQTDKEILVHVDLPGVQKDTIKAVVQSGTLVHISAVRKGGKEIEKWVTLPVLVQESGFRGEYVDGVLSLTLIKAGQGDKEVQIPIR
ncbi:MAG: hypothetical protein MOGMAGMI_02122 [Candidatus Omnitrophica bacterium]|nr:hypothetical protein [Candidatus Omnitrophota bacterium]